LSNNVTNGKAELLPCKFQRNLRSSGVNLTKRELLAQILQQYKQRGDAMRYLNRSKKIAWKASPRFLNMLADAERDARDDLADWP
jgi:hypothetical protein